MYITHSYLGMTTGQFRCSFFLLLKDYIEEETRLANALSPHIERLARDLGDHGVVIQPFTGDIEQTRSHVLAKQWTDAERTQILGTPGLLMINTDFDSFDPRQHPWLFIHLGRSTNSATAAEILHRLVEAVSDAETNVFDSVRQVMDEIEGPGIKDVIGIGPLEVIPGVSVDLQTGARLVRRLWARFSENKRVLVATVDGTGWTKCPKCGIRFSIHDGRRYSCNQHKTCGAYLKLVEQATE